MSHDVAPGFLVASPTLRCPFFNHTVILMMDHSEEGSFGFVINKESKMRMGKILTDLGLLEPGAPPVTGPVLVGGPVSPESGWVVFDPSTPHRPLEEVITVAPSVSVSASLEILEAVAAGEGPERRLMMLGYSGWAPGQLEDEMREGSWIPTDLDPGLIFDTPVDERWETALRFAGIDPARVVSRKVYSA